MKTLSTLSTIKSHNHLLILLVIIMPERLTTIEGDIDEIIRFIGKVQIFKGLSQESLEKSQRKYKWISLPKIFLLLREGQ